MADKSFGVKELNLLNASGTPTVTSPNNLNLNANTVAISTSCTIGNNLTVTSTTNSANLNVTGIGTLTRAFATDLSVSGVTTITVPANANPHSSWDVVNNSASAYRFTGPGQDGAEDNPNIYLVRGQRYVFKMNASGHPFQIRVANAGAAYSDGVTNNGSQTGNVVFNVQHDAPAQLFYQCTSHGSMVGNIYIVGGPQVISGVVTATTFVGNLTGNVTGTASANAVLTGSTNNQLVTVTGANAITGEANLTFDGTVLTSDQIRYASGGNKYHGHPRSVVIGYSGSNYANLGMGWVPTSTNDQYTSANSDYQARLQLYDGLQIYGSGASVTSGQTVTWNTVADFKPSAIKLYTSGSSNSEKLRITSAGQISVGDAISGMDMGFGNQMFSSKSGTYSAQILGSTGAALTASIIYNSNSSFGSSVALCDWRSARSNNTAFNFLRVSTNGASDNEFFLTGDGNGYADGNWNSGGADYAEYFEWSDGNSSDEDRRGYTVVLDGNKVRIATSSDSTDNIIGVVSGHPTMVGDTAWNKWIGKYQRDDYNAYVRDSNGDRVLNSSYDDTQTYISRKDRKEWDTIGLVGKLRIRKGQSTGTRWLKMRDVSDTIEEWLVR